MQTQWKTVRCRGHKQTEVIMNSVASCDLKCPLCGEINKRINLAETRGTMECINCHVLVHVKMQPDGNIEITGCDGYPYHSDDDEEDL